MEDVIDWPFIRLGKVLTDMQPGFAQRPGDSNANVPQLRTNNVSPNGTIELSDIIYVYVDERDLEKYQVKKGDVIFNNTNSVEWVGKTAYFNVEGSYVLSNHMTRLRVNEKVLDAQYLAAYLHYHWYIGKARLLSKQWVNQAAIDQAILSSIVIPLPPLLEQRRIAAILREADEIRKLRQEANEKPQKIVEALFYDMFGDPETNPKNWGKKSLSQLGVLDRGRSQHRPRDAAHLYGGPYPFIQTGNIANSDGWITQYSQTYSEAGLNQSRLWPKGTLCITIAANIAKTAILTFDACFPDSIVGFIPGPDVTIEYIRQWFTTIQNRLEKIAPQAAQKNINLDILRKLILPVPPKDDLQTDFSTKVRDIYTTSETQIMASEKFEKMLASLLSQAFTGELTASWREQHVEEMAQGARARDIMLKGKATVLIEIKTSASLELPGEETEREDLIDQLSLLQRALLDIFLRNRQSYFTANQLYEEELQDKRLQASLDQARRELRTLAALGLIREITLPVTEQPRRVDYAMVYRYPQSEDNTMSEDLELLATRSL